MIRLTFWRSVTQRRLVPYGPCVCSFLHCEWLCAQINPEASRWLWSGLCHLYESVERNKPGPAVQDPRLKKTRDGGFVALPLELNTTCNSVGWFYSTRVFRQINSTRRLQKTEKWSINPQVHICFFLRRKNVNRRLSFQILHDLWAFKKKKNLAMFGHTCELIMRVGKSVRGCMCVCVCGFVCDFRIQTHSSGVWEIKGEKQGLHTTASRRHLCLCPLSDSLVFHNRLDLLTSQLYLNFWNVVI